MPDNNAVIGIYTTHTEAEAAIKELQKAGFNMRKLSIVGKTIIRKSMSSVTITLVTA